MKAIYLNIDGTIRIDNPIRDGTSAPMRLVRLPSLKPEPLRFDDDGCPRMPDPAVTMSTIDYRLRLVTEAFMVYSEIQ